MKPHCTLGAQYHIVDAAIAVEGRAFIVQHVPLSTETCKLSCSCKLSPCWARSDARAAAAGGDGVGAVAAQCIKLGICCTRVQPLEVV